ncbi:MAG TPA: outer membrane beta-barrel protein [Gemmatimonadales bacterium]|nr:outer membrane beta-barrel protein [Gemmatimonadales bacterium]
MVRMLCAGAVAGLLFAAPLQAQSARSGFGITPYAGYMKFGSIVDGPLGTRVRGAAGPVLGAEATLGLTRGLALVGNVAYASSDLEVGVPVVGGLSVGRSSALLYDAALRLSVPLGDRGGPAITPFVQAGAGAMRQEFEVAPVATRSTNFAYNLGAGVDVPLGPRLGLQVMAKDYIGKFDVREATAVDVDAETAHNWTVSAGVRLGL